MTNGSAGAPIPKSWSHKRVPNRLQTFTGRAALPLHDESKDLSPALLLSG